MAKTDPDSADMQLVPTDGQTDVVDVLAMAWKDLAPGVRCKVLYRDERSGLSCVLFNFAAGATTPRHVHTGLECTYVIEGSLEDHDSLISAGNFAVRRAGSVHQARAPQGSLHLAFFTGPVKDLGSAITAFSAGAPSDT